MKMRIIFRGGDPMKSRTDLRVLRTRQMLKDAFFELMETVGFKKITVDGLTKKAFVSRNTFYSHYTDKYDLLRSLEDEVLEEIKGIMADMPGEIARSRDELSAKVKPIIIRFFEYIQNNERFFDIIVIKGGDPAFLSKMGDMVKGVIRRGFSGKTLRVPEHYMAAVAVGMQIGVIDEWLKRGMKESPEEIAALLTTTFRNIPNNLLST
jgi:AcrR family transcriptional regulator